jgi:hypothetical protein
MESNDREGINPNAGAEQTSFGNQLNTNFGGTTGGFSETNRSSTSETTPLSDDAGTGRSGSFEDPGSRGGVTGKVKSVANSVRGKASNLPAMIADGLQAGAEALRQKRSSLAAGTGSGSTAITEDSNLVAVTDSIATGMQSSADWIRDADLDKLKEGVETQVKEHPARTLLIALGAGYILGKAFRR